MCAKYSLPPFDWLKLSHHLVSGESTLHEVTLFEARSRIFLPTAESCAALFCCRLAIRASSLGWLVGNYAVSLIKCLEKWYHMCQLTPKRRLFTLIIAYFCFSKSLTWSKMHFNQSRVILSVEPRCNEGLRNWQNTFVIARFRNFEVLFDIFCNG